MKTAAILGAGAAGLLHSLSLRAHGIAVTQVFDPAEDRAKALAELCGARVVTRLEDVDADIVSIASPPRFHVAQARAFRDRIVFVEKPVCVSLEELRELSTFPRCHPIVQWREGRALRAMRAAIERGAFGETPSVSIDLAWFRGEAYHAARPNWGCGALLSVGVHAVDAVIYALGSTPRDVVCMRNAEHETLAVMSMRFANGALASLRLSFDAGPDRTTITFAGNGISATIEGGEADPTAGPVRWSPNTTRSLVDLESAADGHLHGPLIVPFFGRALTAIRAGSAALSIADVAPAHDAILRGYAAEAPPLS